jgi:lipopolysaccharide heptosyltransferase I
VNIAIVRLTSLGDIIFCMAALQLIKRRLPDCSITWFADRKFADILDHNPDLDGIVKIDLKGLKRDFSLRKLRSEYRQLSVAGRFDLVIDLHGMIKSALIARMICGETAGFHRGVIKEPLAALFYKRTFPVSDAAVPVYRYAQLALKALGFSCAEDELIDKRPYLFYRDEDLIPGKDFFKSGRKNIILVPGTSAAEKNYPWERYVAIADGLRQNALICHGSDSEYETACAIAARSPYVSVLPRLNLNQLKAVISRADLVVGGDTGPTHIAWANNVPSIALFGPTPPCTFATAVNKIVTAPVAHGAPSILDIEVNTILTLAGELLQ